MPSEKMRYFKNYPATAALRNSGLPERAKVAFAGIGYNGIDSIVNRFADFDAASEYFIITHFLELTAADVRLVLNSAIERLKDSNDIISEDDEHKLRLVVAPIFERSVDLAEAGKFIEAVEPVLVIFTIVENEMSHVVNEGFSFQMLIEECFETLKKIANYEYDIGIARQLKTLCFNYNKERDHALSCYDDEWADVSDALCRI